MYIVYSTHTIHSLACRGGVRQFGSSLRYTYNTVQWSILTSYLSTCGEMRKLQLLIRRAIIDLVGLGALFEAIRGPMTV